MSANRVAGASLMMFPVTPEPTRGFGIHPPGTPRVVSSSANANNIAARHG